MPFKEIPPSQTLLFTYFLSYKDTFLNLCSIRSVFILVHVSRTLSSREQNKFLTVRPVISTMFRVLLQLPLHQSLHHKCRCPLCLLTQTLPSSNHGKICTTQTPWKLCRFLFEKLFVLHLNVLTSILYFYR